MAWVQENRLPGWLQGLSQTLMATRAKAAQMMVRLS
jgi:hypothetical protein